MEAKSHQADTNVPTAYICEPYANQNRLSFPGMQNGSVGHH